MASVNIPVASRLPAIEPTYLEEDELQYELDIRAITEHFTMARHRTAALRNRMQAETRGTALLTTEVTASSVESDLELFQIEEKLRHHELRLRSITMDDSMREAHLNRIYHLVGRISRVTFHTNAQFEIGERLWERMQIAIDECRPMSAVVLDPLSELVPESRRPWNTTLNPIGAAAIDVYAHPSSRAQTNSCTMNVNTSSATVATATSVAPPVSQTNRAAPYINRTSADVARTTSGVPPVPPRSNNSVFLETNPFRHLAENMSLRRISVPTGLGWSFNPSGASSPTVYDGFPPVTRTVFLDPRGHGGAPPVSCAPSVPLAGSTFTYGAGHPIYSQAVLPTQPQISRTVPVSMDTW